MNRISKRKLVFVKVCSLSVFSNLQTRKKSKKKKKRRPKEPILSPRFTSSRFTSPRLTSPRFTSPRFTSPRFTNPRFTSPRCTSPVQSSPVQSVRVKRPAERKKTDVGFSLSVCTILTRTHFATLFERVFH